MALDSVIQELVDKAAIRELMMKYARGIDRRDLDLIASGFTPRNTFPKMGMGHHGLNSFRLSNPALSSFVSEPAMGNC